MLTKSAKCYIPFSHLMGNLVLINVFNNQTNGRPEYDSHESYQTSHRIYLGTGTTMPTANDYTLESQDLNLTLTGTSFNYADNYDSDYILTCTSTWKNETSNSVTITELGLFIKHTQGTSQYPLSENFLTSSGGTTVMLVREIIEPIVIQPNEVKTFTMTIGNNYEDQTQIITKNGKLFWGLGDTKLSLIFKKGNGTTETGKPYYMTTAHSSSKTKINKVYLGSGNNNPISSDYILNNPITNLTILGTYSSTPDRTNCIDNYIFTCTTTYKNETNNPITVTELGLFLHIKITDDSAGDSLNYNTLSDGTMVARQVIDPIVIQPNEIKAFTMTIGN